ncbi:hypothetical protein MRX96_052079 [Rhipicephalus microplus]
MEGAFCLRKTVLQQERYTVTVAMLGPALRCLVPPTRPHAYNRLRGFVLALRQPAVLRHLLPPVMNVSFESRAITTSPPERANPSMPIPPYVGATTAACSQPLHEIVIEYPRRHCVRQLLLQYLPSQTPAFVHQSNSASSTDITLSCAKASGLIMLSRPLPLPLLQVNKRRDPQIPPCHSIVLDAHSGRARADE